MKAFDTDILTEILGKYCVPAWLKLGPLLAAEAELPAARGKGEPVSSGKHTGFRGVRSRLKRLS